MPISHSPVTKKQVSAPPNEAIANITENQNIAFVILFSKFFQVFLE